MEVSNQDLVANTSVSAQLEAPARIPRVAVVGTGYVGSTTAYALLMSGTPAEIVLIDRDHRRAEGHAYDLLDPEAFTCSGRILVRDFCDCCSSDVTIITTGVSQVGLKS